jgi:putative flavoprotein involved in K+ transport
MGTTPIIIGAGPAGLATAACLQELGVESVVVDRGQGVGQSWRDRYERLHLHTPRMQSHLPGVRIPRSFGQYVARRDVVRYLVGYARHFGIEPRLGISVDRIDRDGDAWRLVTSDGDMTAPVVVVATGYNAVPVMPDWQGAEAFAGTLLHAAQYRVPDPYVGRDVLVVGTGNTGAEIAADLAEQGARRVWLSVRTPPHIVPRSIGPLPVTLIGIANEYTPAALADPINAALERATVGDLSPYGMPTPAKGLVAQYRETDTIPIIDVGLVEQVRAGRVAPVAAVEAFDGDRVVLADGTRLAPDAVIAATGYRTGLDDMVGHLGILDGGGRPLFHDRDTHPDAPGLHFVGLTNPLIGLLNAIRIDARRTARAIADRSA